MIGNKFSAAAFEAAGFGSAQAFKLSTDLRLAIAKELDKVIEPAMLAIVDKLNAMGHRLEAIGELRPGDKLFREPLNNEADKHKFVVALDLVLSVGYPQTVEDTHLHR